MKETGVRNTPASSGEEAAPNPPDSGELRPPVPDYPQNPAGIETRIAPSNPGIAPSSPA